LDKFENLNSGGFQVKSLHHGKGKHKTAKKHIFDKSLEVDDFSHYKRSDFNEESKIVPAINVIKINGQAEIKYLWIALLTRQNTMFIY